MCDERTNRDNEIYLSRSGQSRRDFSTGVSLAILAAMLPGATNAATVVESNVTVKTPDGESDCYLAHPASGRHAAVIMWPDIMSIRPAFRMMGKRLAESGYAVLVVNPYYRTHKGEVIKEGEGFHMPEVRERLKPHYTSQSPITCVTDGKAYVDYLDKHPAADPSKQIGTCGYCMTGSYALRLAAAAPQRMGAAASFHGGGLVTEGSDSPHLLMPEIDAGLLIAIAENDDEKAPQDKTILRQACEQAGVQAEIEVYEGAMHGWCPLDSRVYNKVQAERAWGRMLALFEQQLA